MLCLRPHVFSSGMQDASRLAVKIVSNYGLSDAGITTYAAPGHAMGFMQKSFEVMLACCQRYWQGFHHLCYTTLASTWQAHCKQHNDESSTQAGYVLREVLPALASPIQCICFGVLSERLRLDTSDSMYMYGCV